MLRPERIIFLILGLSGIALLSISMRQFVSFSSKDKTQTDHSQSKSKESESDSHYIKINQVHSGRDSTKLIYSYLNPKMWATDSYSREHCVTGHGNKRLLPMCAPDGCLSIMNGDTHNKPKSTPKETLQKIEQTKGWGKIIYYHVTSFFTSMQWSFGIYGSVGEIGVYYGRYASMLALNTGTEYGERFFACDIFEDATEQKKFKTEEGRIKEFEKAMQNVGFSINATKETYRVRIYDGSSLHLNKHIYSMMDLPAFRFYSIDGNHHLPYVLHDLQHVTCVLREGGIIAMDDYKNGMWPGVEQAIRLYLQMYGADVILPLLEIWPKLFMCSSSWHEKYISYMKQNKDQYKKDTGASLCEKEFDMPDKTKVKYFGHC